MNHANSANTADTAANAAKLGGDPPSAYQGFCKAGAIKATLVINNAGFNCPTFQNVPGFNCFEPGNTTTSVQMKRNGQGAYEIRFVGNSGADSSGSAVCSSLAPGFDVSCFSGTDSSVPGAVVFFVKVLVPGVGLTDNAQFSLLAF